MRKLSGALLLALLLPSAVPAAPSDPAESLAHFVPADVGLYIEGRGIADLLLPLTEPQAWLTLAELAGQPAAVEETAQWRARLRQTIQMDPAEAIGVLFSDQFAVVAEGVGRAQDAAVLCRPIVDARTLVERWQAQPLPTAGRTSVYGLPNRVGLARPDGLLVFGDAAPVDGMFRRLLSFCDQREGASLAADPAYRALLARVPDHPDAIMFARLAHERQAPTSAPTTAPSADGPAGPLGGASNILLALSRSGNLLHFSAVGDGPARHRARRSGLNDLAERLPQRTLLAWGTHLDYQTLKHAAEKLPDNALLGIAFRMQQSSGSLERLAATLGSATCLAIGVVEPASRVVPAPPIPAVAVLVASDQPDAAAAELDALLESSASICNLMALKIGSRLTVPAVERISLGDTQARRIDLSTLLREQPGGAHIAELHLCWAVDEGVLIIASHSNWLEQILAARRGESPTLSSLVSLSPRRIAADSETVVAIQAGLIADLGALWLAHLERAAPAVLDEDWWRARQPGGANVRLGVQATEYPGLRRLRVTSVTAGSPADGLLKPGDEILGCNGQLFATSQPVREIRAAIAERPHARWVELELARVGTRLPRRVPLPFVDPIQMLRRAIAVGRIVQRVVYHDEPSDEGGPRGLLSIELRSAEQPLPFTFELTPPITTSSRPSPP